MEVTPKVTTKARPKPAFWRSAPSKGRRPQRLTDANNLPKGAKRV
jgi:hypothetical protein